MFLIESRVRSGKGRGFLGRWGPWEIDYGVGVMHTRQEAFETAAALNGISENLQYRMGCYAPIHHDMIKVYLDWKKKHVGRTRKNPKSAHRQ